MKLRQDPNFEYDSDCTQFLLERVNDKSEIRQQRNERICSEGEKSAVINSEENKLGYSAITTNISWIDVYKLPVISNSVSCSELASDNTLAVVLSGSHGRHLDNNISSPVTSHVNTDSGGGEHRRLSSTRFDFLDSFLSISSKPRTVSNEMSDEGSDVRSEGVGKCTCSGGNSCSICCEAIASGSKSEPNLSSLLQAFEKAIGKIDELKDEVRSLKEGQQSTQARLGKLEAGRASSDSQARSQSESDRAKHHRKEKPKSSKKQEKVDFEKDRSLKIMEDKLEDRRRRGESQNDEVFSSDGHFNLQALRKNMSRSEKTECSDKVASTLRQSGAVFPQEEYCASGSSGMESEAGARYSRRKVKSGANISKRPVVQTELWPHTIANEDDIEEVSSENITLAKFMSCFSHIMVNCGRAEATGRAVLLHAVSLVLECLPWAEARSFHNLVMIKIEQGRINWDTDFEILAGQFLDKRVRLSLRSRGTATGSGPGKSGRSTGRGYRTPGQNFNDFNPRFNTNNYNRNKAYYVCKQWNIGTCSYGDSCKRWHVCLSCAEAGRMGEHHKSTTHTGGRGRPEQSRV